MKNFQYLIIGQGLAGSCLAMELLKAKQDFLILDQENPQSATNVGAGIANPLSGKGLNLTWMANELFPSAEKFYRETEKLCQDSFYYPRNILRIFINQKQQEIFQEKRKNYADYIETNQIKIPKYLNAEHGAFITKKSFFLLTKKFKATVRKYLEQQGKLISNQDNYNFEKIIYCTGYAKNNPELMNFIKFRPARGEILDLKIPKLSEKYIINFGKFLLPLGNQIFRLGATYSWDNFSKPPEQVAKEELITAMKNYLTLDFKILTQQTSVRPIVSGSIPVIGSNPNNQNILFFNGLGSKGSLYAPYFAKMLVEHLVNKKEILAEVSTERFL